eukprot:4070456-Pyramimonas_sp.AAC.1
MDGPPLKLAFGNMSQGPATGHGSQDPPVPNRRHRRHNHEPLAAGQTVRPGASRRAGARAWAICGGLMLTVSANLTCYMTDANPDGGG